MACASFLQNGSKGINVFSGVAPERNPGPIWHVRSIFGKVNTLRLRMVADCIVAHAILLLEASGEVECRQYFGVERIRFRQIFDSKVNVIE
jgi:hypothetical protein